MRTLNVVIALLVAASCGSPKPSPKQVVADREDRARSLCISTAQSHKLRVSSTDAPVAIDAHRYDIGMRTRDSVGVASRRCIADVDLNRAQII